MAPVPSMFDLVSCGGSTPTPTPVPSLSNLSWLWGDQFQIQIHLWIIICVKPFEGPLHLWLLSHLCLTLDHVGGQLQLQLQSHLCPTWADCGGQFQIQIHLWIIICVIPFEGPLHLWLQSHLCHTLDHVGGQLQLQLQSNLCPTWADCVGSTLENLEWTPLYLCTEIFLLCMIW